MDKRYSLSSNIIKSEFFSLLKKDDRNIIKSLAGKEVFGEIDPKDEKTFILIVDEKKFRVPRKQVYDY